MHYFALEPDYFYSCDISYDNKAFTYKVVMEKHGPLDGILHEWPMVEFEIKALGELIFDMHMFDSTDDGKDALDRLLITEYNTKTNEVTQNVNTKR